MDFSIALVVSVFIFVIYDYYKTKKFNDNQSKIYEENKKEINKTIIDDYTDDTDDNSNQNYHINTNMVVDEEGWKALTGPAPEPSERLKELFRNRKNKNHVSIISGNNNIQYYGNHFIVDGIRYNITEEQTREYWYNVNKIMNEFNKNSFFEKNVNEVIEFTKWNKDFNKYMDDFRKMNEELQKYNKEFFNKIKK